MSDVTSTRSTATPYRSWVDRMIDGFRADPHRIVVRDTNGAVSGGPFAAMIDRYAHALAARGLRPGDRVALLATESAEALAVRYAVALVGAASVFTPDTGRPERLVRFLKQVHPRLLVVFPETAPHAQAAAARVLSDETVAVGPVDGLADLAAEAAAQPDAPFVGRARPDDLAVLIASGGTTGGSKASMRSFAAYAALLGDGRDPDRKLLTCSAFAYVSQVLIAQTLVGGGSVTLRDRFDGAELLAVVESDRITQLSLVEPLLAEFADHPALPETDLSSLRRVSHIGASAPASFRMRLLDRFGPILVNTYGASEAGMVSVLAAPDYGLDHPERLGTAGRPRPGVEVRIDAATGGGSGTGQGVIEVRLPGMSSGYIGRPEDPAFHDGWYTTGDLGFLDADGFLHVRGRAADAREVDGVTVVPLDLEDAACAHPDVAYAVALPTDDGPDGRFGVLVLRARGAWVEADAIRDHLMRTVEPPAAVGAVVVVDHLPVTEQGKPDRAIVSELLRP